MQLSCPEAGGLRQEPAPGSLGTIGSLVLPSRTGLVSLLFSFPTVFLPRVCCCLPQLLRLPASAALATASVAGPLRGAAGWAPSLSQGDMQIPRISSEDSGCCTNHSPFSFSNSALAWHSPKQDV